MGIDLDPMHRLACEIRKLADEKVDSKAVCRAHDAPSGDERAPNTSSSKDGCRLNKP